MNLLSSKKDGAIVVDQNKKTSKSDVAGQQIVNQGAQTITILVFQFWATT
jgi:hypothetical protein